MGGGRGGAGNFSKSFNIACTHVMNDPRTKFFHPYIILIASGKKGEA